MVLKESRWGFAVECEKSDKKKEKDPGFDPKPSQT
jgi:hypothetical protein